MLSLRSPIRDKRNIESLLERAGIPIGTDERGAVKFHDERAFSSIIGSDTVGLIESYMAGWWDSTDLALTLEKGIRARLENTMGIFTNPGRLLSIILSKATNRQTKSKSLQVASDHYDLGNNFYGAMLGPTRQYTCARFITGEETLDEAQLAKMDLVSKKANLQSGDKVLEMGNGWGMLSKHMAEQYGVTVDAYNLSKEQVDYGRSINGKNVKINHQDYRDSTGRFDKVISVGMLEHVGPKNYRRLFETLDRLIPEKGLVILHSITSNNQLVRVSRGFDKYIFAGGVTPAVFSVRKAAEGIFDEEDVHNSLWEFNGTPKNYIPSQDSDVSSNPSMQYSPTLKFWHDNFQTTYPEFKDEAGEIFVNKFGTIYPGDLSDPSTTFQRMEEYYLLASKAAFDSGNIHLTQFVFSKGYKPGEYEIVR